MKKATFSLLPILLFFPLSVRLLAQTSDLVITGFDSGGELRWSHSATSGSYAVEWASSLTGSWSRSWMPLVGMTATGTEHSALVPMAYRVVYNAATNARTVEVQTNESLGVGMANVHGYSGTLQSTPIKPGSLTIDCGGLSFADNSIGVLAGLAGTSGSIDYFTGAWTINLGPLQFPSGVSITGHYTYLRLDFNSIAFPVSDLLLGYGLAGQNSYAGTLFNTPVVPGTLWISGDVFAFGDDGKGSLTGSDGGGTITYWTGAWTLNMVLPTISQDTPIAASYQVWTMAGERLAVRNQIVAFGIAGKHTYAGTLQHGPVVTGSFHLTAGSCFFTDDDGDGFLTGTAGTTGTVSYATGTWTIDLGALEVTPGRPIIASYSFTVTN